MVMKYTLLIISLFAASAVAQAAQGGSEVQAAIKQPPSFEDVDVNKDGAISKDEAANANVLNDLDFSAADKDGNGMLSKEEYQQALAQKSSPAQQQHKGS
jgi:hypothetical protein